MADQPVLSTAQGNGVSPHVCLIIPPSGFLLDERVFPSLGVLKVAAALEAAKVSVSVLDLSGMADVIEALDAHRRPIHGQYAGPADVYGLTATMPQMPAAMQIAHWLRQNAPTARLILGGPHATLVNASAKNERKAGQQFGRGGKMLAELLERFDVVVAGDGEKTIGLALDKHAHGLIDADDPSTSFFLTRADLNEAPLPARHLIDLASYRYQIDGHKTTSLIAQLGCPFGCNFCGGRRSPFLRRVRLRSTAAVVAEVEHLHDRYGYTGFMFLDDELNVNPEFLNLLRGLQELQGRLGVQMRFRGLLKSELVTPEMAQQMYRTGFRQILVGFESGSPRMLLNMNKHATRDDNTRCVETLRNAGIKVKALMSLGHPGESYETVDETRDWLLAVKPDDVDVTIITVYPGTPYFDDATPFAEGAWRYASPNGDNLYYQQTDHLKDVNFYKGIPGQYRSFVWTDDLTREEMVQCRDAVETDVRQALGIPWPTSAAEVQYEKSMGMSSGR